MVFQNYALFPHLTVWQNVAYGLRLRQKKAEVIREKIEAVLELLEIGMTANRYPNQLSGGQQQRVALARALVLEPDLLLFDEPLSNLDAQLRLQMRKEIRNLQKRLNITTIYVTHDQEEALTISDRIVLMHRGKVEQVGTPEEIYFRPRSRFAAEFLGEANFISGQLRGTTADDLAFCFETGSYLALQSACFTDANALVEGPAVIMIRPEAVIFDPLGSYEGTIVEEVFLGSHRQYLVQAFGTTLKMNRQWDEQDGDYLIGSRVRFRLDTKGVQVLYG